MTAREFLKSKQADEFRRACERVNIEPTIRQVRRWRRKEGLAWKKGRTE